MGCLRASDHRPESKTSWMAALFNFRCRTDASVSVHLLSGKAYDYCRGLRQSLFAGRIRRLPGVAAPLLYAYAPGFPGPACSVGTGSPDLWTHFFAGYRLEKIIHKGDAGELESISEIVVVIIVCVLAFLFSNFSFVVSSSPFSGNIIQDIFYIRTLVDLGGLAILYAYQGHMREVHVRKELSHINTLLQNQYHYYRNYQESVELVNIRYHDLKHQIDALRNMKDADERNQWLDALEEEIEQYHISVHTGNAVLDTILAGKMLLCKKHNIRMTCVADGKLLSFLHVTDICSIFGNALDNAIENVTDIPDPEKRLIHISITSKKGFVYIRIENYTQKPLKLKADGRTPETTPSAWKRAGLCCRSCLKTCIWGNENNRLCHLQPAQNKYDTI